RLAARARRGARPLDPDADDEIVAGHALDLLPRPLDDVLLARGAHRRAHVLAALHRRRAVAPELRVLGDQLRERIAVAAAQRVTEIGEELIDVVHRPFSLPGGRSRVFSRAEEVTPCTRPNHPMKPSTN